MKRILALALFVASFPASAALVCANNDYAEYAVWRIGQSADVLFAVDTDGAVWCEASEAELGYIQKTFAGLRWHNGKDLSGNAVIFWQGDDAAFIIDNL
jgi:hypothetical protein